MVSTENVIPQQEGSQEIQKRLGKGYAISHPKMLQLNNYLGVDVKVPSKYDFWKTRSPFPIQDWGNNLHGNCTIASQGELSQYAERLETRRTDKIPTQNIIDTYYNLTSRLYGGGDTGAYELDALNNWRNPDLTFRNIKGNPLTIDAFTRVDQSNIEEVKRALFLSTTKTIKVCFALPWAWARVRDRVWDIPEGQEPIGDYQPYSWGGHSTTALSKYDEKWVYILSSWQEPPYKISWRAFAIYADECYLCVDSVDAWRKKLNKKQINFKALVSDVNMVSDVKIRA